MNVYQLSPNVYRVHEYNFLPYMNRGIEKFKDSKPMGLDGHYVFYFNPKTKEYLVLDYAGYGGLTWTTERKKAFISITPQLKEYLDDRFERKEWYIYKTQFPNNICSTYSDEIIEVDRQAVEYLENGNKAAITEYIELPEYPVFTPEQTLKSLQLKALRRGLWSVNYTKSHYKGYEALEYRKPIPAKLKKKFTLNAEVRVKGKVFKKYYCNDDKLRDCTIITINDLLVYACTANIGAPSQSAFDTLTETFGVYNSDKGTHTMASTHKIEQYTEHWFSGESVKETAVITDKNQLRDIVDNIYVHF